MRKDESIDCEHLSIPSDNFARVSAKKGRNATTITQVYCSGIYISVLKGACLGSSVQLLSHPSSCVCVDVKDFDHNNRDHGIAKSRVHQCADG